MGMGMGGWGAIAGAVTGFISSREAQKQGRQWNRYVVGASNQMLPSNVMGAAYQYNPFLWAALGQQGLFQNSTYNSGGKMTQQGTTNYADTPYSKSLANLINNPGYVDPKIMDQNLRSIDRSAASNLSTAQGRIGMSGAQGGLGAAFALANQAGRTNQKSALMQQYILFREQQRRSDISMINDMIQQSIGTASQNQLSKANFLIQRKPTVGWRGVVGATAAGAAEGYGLGKQAEMPGMKQSYSGQPVQGGYNPQPQQSSNANNITPENNPMGGFMDAQGSGGQGMFGGNTSNPVSTPSNSPTVYGTRPQIG